MKWAKSWKRWVTWAIAAAALTFVIRMVPIRDRCGDPDAPSAAHVAVSRDAEGCTLHRAGGPLRIDGSACARLTCEPGLASTLAHTRIDVALSLFALYLMSTLAWAARWRMLLGLADIRMPLFTVWRVTLEAQAGGVLLPGGIGGDALRIASAVERGAPLSLVVGSVLLDRAAGLSTLAMVALALALALGEGEAGALTLALALVPIGFVLALALLRTRFVAGRAWLHRGKLGAAVKPVIAYVGNARAPQVIARALLLSVLVSSVQLFVVRGLFFALGATPTSDKWVYVGSTIMFVVSALPALPGGWGTGDAAFVFFMGRAGLLAAAALATLLLFRAFWYTSGLIGAALLLARRVGSARPTPRI